MKKITEKNRANKPKKNFFKGDENIFVNLSKIVLFGTVMFFQLELKFKVLVHEAKNVKFKIYCMSHLAVKFVIISC